MRTLALHGILPLQCDTTADGVVIMDRPRAATLIDARSVSVLGELRTGAHTSNHGFITAMERSTRSVHAHTRSVLGGQLRTNILRLVTFFANLMHHARLDLEPPDVAACWACTKLPPAAYLEHDVFGDADDLGGHATLILDGGHFVQNSALLVPASKLSTINASHPGHTEEASDGDMPEEDTASHLPHHSNRGESTRPFDLTDNLLVSGTRYVQGRHLVRAFYETAETFKPSPSTTSDTTACGADERKMTCWHKPTPLATFDKSLSTRTAMVLLCGCSIVPYYGIATTPGHECHAIADACISNVIHHRTWWPFQPEGSAPKWPRSSTTLIYDLACRFRVHFHERHAHHHGGLTFVPMCHTGLPMQHMDLDGVLRPGAFCVDTLHSYGHVARCRILNGQLRCEGSGYANGSACEQAMHAFNRCART